MALVSMRFGGSALGWLRSEVIDLFGDRVSIWAGMDYGLG